MGVTVAVTHRPGAGPGATVVRLAGEIDGVTSPRARKDLEPVVASAPPVVVFDLGETTFVSSAGISVLLDARRRLEKAGSRVFVTNMQPQIAKVMDIVKALPKQSIFGTMKEMDEYLAEIQRRVTTGDDEF